MPKKTDEPVTIYPFHAPHEGLPDLFHVRCDDHPSLGFCGPRAGAEMKADEHRREAHDDA